MNLNVSNRPVRTRLPGGVGGVGQAFWPPLSRSSLQQRLFDLDDLQSFSDLSTFTQNIPIGWVESALRLASKATIRRRRLPCDQVLWLVLGMALFRNEPIAEVARRLNICAQGLATDHLLAPSGVSQARRSR